MGEVENYLEKATRQLVWSGFYDDDLVEMFVDDMALDESLTESATAELQAYASAEIEKKQAAEKSWPKVTDCDKLDKVFDELNSKRKLVALQNRGTTQSDGVGDVSEVFHDRADDSVLGYCFFHSQDLERVMAGESLWLAFGSFEDQSKDAEIAEIVVETFKDHEFDVAWNCDPQQRISVANIDWKRRTT